MPNGAEKRHGSPDGGAARDADDKRGARALGASVIGLLVAIGALIVLALATSTDAPVVTEPRKAAPIAAPGAGQEGGTPAQIRANLEQSNALIDTPLDAKLAALRGVPVVVNQWASWCGPCRAEFPFFAELAERYERDVAFVGLNSRDERGAAQAFLAEHPVPYPSVFDERGAQARSIGAGASWPTTVFYNAEGTPVLIRQGGYVDVGALEAEIRRHALGLR
jgi:cytochrome c biogenesis protein CcmG/thiol:disulfide interchange protein DsbE